MSLGGVGQFFISTPTNSYPIHKPFEVSLFLGLIKRSIFLYDLKTSQTQNFRLSLSKSFQILNVEPLQWYPGKPVWTSFSEKRSIVRSTSSDLRVVWLLFCYESEDMTSDDFFNTLDLVIRCAENFVKAFEKQNHLKIKDFWTCVNLILRVDFGKIQASSRFLPYNSFAISYDSTHCLSVKICL